MHCQRFWTWSLTAFIGVLDEYKFNTSKRFRNEEKILKKYQSFKEWGSKSTKFWKKIYRNSEVGIIKRIWKFYASVCIKYPTSGNHEYYWKLMDWNARLLGNYNLMLCPLNSVWIWCPSVSFWLKTIRWITENYRKIRWKFQTDTWIYFF